MIKPRTIRVVDTRTPCSESIKTKHNRFVFMHILRFKTYLDNLLAVRHLIQSDRTGRHLNQL